ncbi:hypothetical protein AB0O42_11025 [Streptomyces sp. NPDC089922]|uniref:hypothetical protein n=1 Tax=Streptomyces sp. NPDC089922 TaxID=3155189 RepID=UPI00342D1CD8
MSVGREARLVVGNDGEEPLDLMLEPWGDVHRIVPGETCVVVTHTSSESGAWPGTRLGDEPFEVCHGPTWLTVWVNGDCFHLYDRKGDEIEPYVYGGCPAQQPSA